MWHMPDWFMLALVMTWPQRALDALCWTCTTCIPVSGLDHGVPKIALSACCDGKREACMWHAWSARKELCLMAFHMMAGAQLSPFNQTHSVCSRTWNKHVYLLSTQRAFALSLLQLLMQTRGTTGPLQHCSRNLTPRFLTRVHVLVATRVGRGCWMGLHTNLHDLNAGSLVM